LLRRGGGTGKGGACDSPFGGNGGFMLAKSMRLNFRKNGKFEKENWKC
jgi:hypothetical protein